MPKFVKNNKFSYSGKLIVYVIKTPDSEEIAPREFNLFRMNSSQIPLIYILEQCTIDKFLNNFKDIFISPAQNCIVIENKSDCTITKRNFWVEKGKRVELYYNDSVNILSDDETAELILQYKSLVHLMPARYSADSRRSGALRSGNNYGVKKLRYALFCRRSAGIDERQLFNLHIRMDDKISVALGDLKIEGVTHKQLIDIEIFENVGRHGICQIFLQVDENFDAKTILSWNKTKVKVKADKDIIFCGIICQCRLENRIDANYLNITALSLSCKLESARKSMTFQDDKKKFSDILSTVEKDNKPAEISCRKDEVVVEMIYRENLTDWEFFTELVESHGQILFTDSKTDKLRVSVGFKAFKEISPDDSMKILSRNSPINFYKRQPHQKNCRQRARRNFFLLDEKFVD